MSEMMDRLARVLSEEIQRRLEVRIKADDYGTRPMVRALLDAMREPTEEMLKAASDAGGKAYEYTGGTIVCAPVFSWPAMIDEALK